jgi:hypothetical protein
MPKIWLLIICWSSTWTVIKTGLRLRANGTLIVVIERGGWAELLRCDNAALLSSIAFAIFQLAF